MTFASQTNRMSGAPTDSATQDAGNRPGPIRAWLEIISIPVLMVAGAMAGAMTGFPPLASIGAVALPLVAATIYLRRSDVSWRQLAFGRSLPIAQLVGYVALTLVLALACAWVTTRLLQSIFGLPPTDISGFIALVEGNPVMYAWYLIPVAWGSAAIGEELICRGFLLHRLGEQLATWLAVVLQAFIFAVAHFYQGITGMVAIFVLAIVFGAVYVNSGRNLLPVILAHGLIDTWAMTAIFLGRPELVIGT